MMDALFCFINVSNRHIIIRSSSSSNPLRSGVIVSIRSMYIIADDISSAFLNVSHKIDFDLDAYRSSNCDKISEPLMRMKDNPFSIATALAIVFLIEKIIKHKYLFWFLTIFFYFYVYLILVDHTWLFRTHFKQNSWFLLIDLHLMKYFVNNNNNNVYLIII